MYMSTYTYIFIWRGLLQRLAHSIMEVWKFYNLPVACKLDNQESSWCNLESEGLRIRQPVLSPKAWEPGTSLEGRWAKEGRCFNLSREWICPSFAFLFCSGPQWFRWCQPAWWRCLFSLLIQMLISSGDILTYIPAIMFYHLFGYSFA